MFGGLSWALLGNRKLFDSGKMSKDSPAKTVDLDVADVKCLLLVFEGDKVTGNWANARAIAIKSL